MSIISEMEDRLEDLEERLLSPEMEDPTIGDLHAYRRNYRLIKKCVLPLKEQITKLKETLKGTDTAAIKADTEELQQRFYKIAEKIYQQSQAQSGTNTSADGQSEPSSDTTVNVDDYKVDDNNADKQ